MTLEILFLSNYISEAEKFGNAIVFIDSMNNWKLIDGTSWGYPLGDSNLIALDDHPVTQVSWNDALAYCEFCDKNLTYRGSMGEASERGQKKNQLFYWGDDLVINNKYMCNTWASDYPNLIGFKDGFLNILLQLDITEQIH